MKITFFLGQSLKIPLSHADDTPWRPVQIAHNASARIRGFAFKTNDNESHDSQQSTQSRNKSQTHFVPG